MKVISWNLWAKGAGKRLEEVAHFLKEENPDLIALQEVDRFWGERSSSLDVSKELGKMLGYHHYFSPSIDVGGRQYGNAILSKKEAAASETAILSPGITWQKDNHETEPRSVMVAFFEKPSPTIFMSTHLANAINLQSTKITTLQSEKIVSLIRHYKKNYSNYSLILAGDFNLEPDKQEIIKISQEIKRQGKCLPTWPAQPFSYKGWEEVPPPSFSIDHIFASREFQTRVINTSISDHLPLVGEQV